RRSLLTYTLLACVLCGAVARAAPPMSGDDQAHGPITVNFDNADVHQVLNVLLKDALGYTFVVSPQVTGRVNVQSSRPLTRAQVRDLVNLILKMNHLRMVRRDHLWVVEPARPPVPGARPRMGERSGVQILSLGNLPADQAQAAIQPLLSPDVALKIGPDGRTLLLYGESRKVAEIANAMRQIMAAYQPGLVLRLVRPRYIKLRDLLPELARIEQAQRRFNAKLLPGAVPLPLERQNALLIVAPNAASLQAMLDWIEVLDRPGRHEGASGNIHVYYLKNGRAAEIAKVLSALFNVSVSTVRTPPLQGMPASALGTSLGASGSLGTSSNAGAGNTGFGQFMQGQGQGAPPQSPPASGEQQTVIAAQQQHAAPGVSPGRRIAIVADEADNALVVRAGPSEYVGLRRVIEKLDVAPRQVLIQALIADVTLNKSLQYGIEYYFQSHGIRFGRYGDYTGVGALDSNLGTLTNPPTLGNAANGSVFNYGVFGPAGDLRALFQMLSNRTRVNILSTPEILATNNHTAAIQVGNEVPVVTSTLTTTATSSTGLATSNTIQYRSTGVLLGVTPRINQDGMVTLDVYQEVSSISSLTTGAINSPNFVTRKAQTTLSVQNGATVIIGGLIQTQLNRTRSGVPGLMDLPLLGTLFSTTNRSRQKQELLIMLTPRVVTTPSQLDMLSARFRRQVEALRRMVEQGRVQGAAPDSRNQDNRGAEPESDAAGARHDAVSGRPLSQP
ncbi:MAG: type II secretion system secretin GspD, partial [Gammaproteobacteria bacterium]|nr:type II secretion system secretin GspD [Gammaproteobacteria bacterium]